MPVLRLGHNVKDGSHHRHPHLHRAGHNLHLIHATDGRQVHIAGSPDEALRIRRESKDKSIECIVHGSDDHLNLLRESHASHEDRMIKLKEQHGDLLNEFEETLKQRDAAAAELQNLTSRAAMLDANLMRYGYSTHLRFTEEYGDPEDEVEQGALRKVTTQSWADEKYNSEQMLFWVKAILRQYYHKGKIWRTKKLQEVEPYELFIDLLYVGIVGASGDAAAGDPTGRSLLRFVITFLMGWKIWSELVLFVAWFDAPDVARRLTVLFTLCCLVGLTTNFEGFFDETYTALVGFYLAIQLARAAHYLIYAYLMSTIRSILLLHNTVVLLTSALWIGSIHVNREGARQALLWIALSIDVFANDFLMIAFDYGSKNKTIARLIEKYFEFVPAINIEHRIERTNSFVALVIGYSVLSVLYQSTVSMPLTAFLGKAILGVMQAFAFNAIYFEMDSFNMYTHAIRRHTISTVIFSISHIPLVIGLTLTGAALTRLVLAHDCTNSNVEDLFEDFADYSQETLLQGQRWFYCVGLGAALLSTVAIAFSHSYRVPRTLKHSKTVRLVLRAFIAIAIILLALAKSLSSIQLISITTGLVHVALFSDIFGNMLTDHLHERTSAGFKAFVKRLCPTRSSHTYVAEVPINIERNQERSQDMDEEKL